MKKCRRGAAGKIAIDRAEGPTGGAPASPARAAREVTERSSVAIEGHHHGPCLHGMGITEERARVSAGLSRLFRRPAPRDPSR